MRPFIIIHRKYTDNAITKKKNTDNAITKKKKTYRQQQYTKQNENYESVVRMK